MEDGAKTLAIMLIVSLVLGVCVIAVHKGFRQTAVAMFHGERVDTPIGESNKSYYPEVKLEQQEQPNDSE